MKNVLTSFLLVLLAGTLSAQKPDVALKEVRYTASTEDFINPERGFMSQLSNPREVLDSAVLAGLRAKKESIIWRMFQVRDFRDRPFTEEYLASVRADFDAIRKAGMKVMPRWSYCSRIGDDDAPLDLVMTHIGQLAPILRENADIIVAMNCGFIGAWGEMHSSTHDLTEPENMKKIIFALLDILPPERCVQVRYPRAKYAIFDGEKSPITLDRAFDGSRFSRVAHHNDCFLASPTDVGTYSEDIEYEKAYLHEETKFTPMSGETCNPRSGYPVTYSKTIREMEMMHWSFLNSLYSRQIIDQWVADDYYGEISRRLGYRLELLSGSYQETVAMGDPFSFSLKLRNVGFASPFNPRLVELVLVHAEKGTPYKVRVPQDPRYWFAGETQAFSYALDLPEGMEPGDYKVFLNLPDPMERLYGRPEYSIRLANSDVPFTTDGYNDLGWTVRVVAREHVIKMLPGERWWGAATDLGVRMPFDISTELSFDLARQNFNNQTTPLFLSDKGRYIWCDASFSASIAGGEIRIKPHHGGSVTCVDAGKNLREAFLAASAAHFPPSGKIPPETFINKPQYNTWIELGYNQNQADVLRYAHGIVDNGFPPGILMIDDNWQKYYGSTEFRPDRFPDPKGMVDELHALGFKVMLWICPFVSPDSQEYRTLRRKGYLVKDARHDRPAILDWWNGLSACYDLSNPEAYDYFKGTLTALQEQYGIDGFKFDAGDPERYLQEDVRPYDGKSFDTDQTMLWARLGLEFPYNEFRACWRMGGDALVQRLGDKSYSWRAVASLVPDMISAGLLGHIYTCPDMIGGGGLGSFQNVDQNRLDQDLIVRSCQIHALMPMMQFSVAPWRILDAEHLAVCLKYARLHAELGPYLVEQAKVGSKTGEPIVRSMEYAFPGQGFETCTDQYMLGDRYLVAPMMAPGRSRTVRLPEGRWQDENGKVYKGGRTYELDVPLDRVPRFTRK